MDLSGASPNGMAPALQAGIDAGSSPVASIYRTEGDGRKRPAEEARCGSCGDSFLRRAGQKNPQKFCNPTCAANARRRRIGLTCANCGKLFTKKKQRVFTTKHGLHFCSRKCKDFAQSVDGTCEAIKPPHYGRANFIHNAETLIDRTENPTCSQCGDRRRYCLVVHHIDADRTNNQSSNLEILCGSCHMTRHLVLVDGIWKHNSAYLAPRNLLDKFQTEKL